MDDNFINTVFMDLLVFIKTIFNSIFCHHIFI